MYISEEKNHKKYTGFFKKMNNFYVSYMWILILMFISHYVLQHTMYYKIRLNKLFQCWRFSINALQRDFKGKLSVLRYCFLKIHKILLWRFDTYHSSAHCGFFNLAFSRMDLALISCPDFSSKRDISSHKGIARGHFFSCNV